MTAHKNIYIALAAAQEEMGPVVKGSVNPHYRSKYADLSDVMIVALPALNNQGIAVWHNVVVEADQTKMVMRTTLSHGETETHIMCDVPLIVSKNDMQGMKSATTYAKRIGIESLTGIAPDDDDGNAASQSAKRVQDPWTATILADLPESSTDRDKAQAITAALCSQWKRMKGLRQISNEWDRRAHLIAGDKGLEGKHPDLHETVVDAYELRRQEIEEAAA